MSSYKKSEKPASKFGELVKKHQVDLANPTGTLEFYPNWVLREIWETKF